jgi:hypothetical protein
MRRHATLEIVMTAPSIERMFGEAKFRTLEELWDFITREGDRYESPPWHEQAQKRDSAALRVRRRAARIKTHRFEHRILRGYDADLLLWPDCKRPHDYYW